MAVNLAPIGNDAPYVDSNGDPFSGALLYTYTAGSSTPQPTYTTSAGSIQNSNPMTLNSAGYPTTSSVQTQVWLTAGTSYKFELKNSAGTTIWTRDNISGINDTTVAQDQWVSGPTPTFVSTTSFTLVGDQTTTFHVGRRLKTTNSGGTIYSIISASTFGVVTTVTVVNDSGVLDSGLSAVSYGLLTSTNPSSPLLTDAYPIVSGSSDKTKKVRLEVDGLTTATTRVITVPDVDLTLPYKPGTYGATQVFTSSGTWTKPAGLVRVKVTVVGGGASGGGAADGANTQASGGGGGGYSIKTVAAASLGATETVTIGAGGTAPAAGNNAGNDGGATSFGAHCSATGGTAGNGAATGANVNGVTGGIGSSGDINGAGGAAEYSLAGNRRGSKGGDSLLGAGGLGAVDTAGGAGRVYGGGGAGGSSNGSGATAGGAGAAGIVIVEEFF